MGQDRHHIEIDLSAIAKNVRLVREAVGANTLIMAVIKKNAYGHGIVEVARTCLKAGADRLAVAQVDTVALLRENGIECDVHLLGPPLAGEIDTCVKTGAVAAVTDIETAQMLDDNAAEAGGKARCHLLIDTGMSTLGPPAEDGADLACRVASLEHLELEGAFTHFHSSHDIDQCRSQLTAFLEFVNNARQSGADLPVLHAASSGAVWRLPEAHLDMVRVGLCVPGVYNDGGMRDLVALHPAMRITSAISFVKEVPEGTPISYGSTHVTQRPTVVATVPFGYGDGYNFACSNRGWVAVNGKKAPVLGRITMDYIMVDVTDIPGVTAGAEAVLLGAPGPDAGELAEIADVAPHEILCSLGRDSLREILYTGN